MDGIKHIVESFSGNIKALRGFVESVGPLLQKHHNKILSESIDAVKFIAFVKAKAFSDNEDEVKKATKELEKFIGKEINITNDGNNKVLLDVNLKGSKRSFEDVISNLQQTINNATEGINVLAKSYQQREQLYTSSLISLLSSTEWFLSELLHFYYDKYPDSAGIKKSTLTLEDIKALGDLKNAENYLIDEKVEQILRGNFKQWMGIIKDEMKLNPLCLKIYEDELVEIYQRRNLLVHNGGLVNSIYLSKVATKFKGHVKIGEKLIVDSKYLENAISKLHLVFTMIAAELWKKLDSKDDNRAEFLNQFAYEYLLKEQWEIAEYPSYFVYKDQHAVPHRKTVGQLNYWLCKKSSGFLNVIEKDLNEANFSDKERIFQCALAALREQKREFFLLLPRLLKDEDLTPDKLFEFPIFKNMRAMKEFKKLKAENEIIKKHLGTNKKSKKKK